MEGMYPNLTFGESNDMRVLGEQQRTQNSTSLLVADGLSSDIQGLYSCVTAGGSSIQHYIIPTGQTVAPLSYGIHKAKRHNYSHP